MELCTLWYVQVLLHYNVMTNHQRTYFTKAY